LDRERLDVRGVNGLAVDDELGHAVRVGRKGKYGEQ
jgi:hypothetical protein